MVEHAAECHGDRLHVRQAFPSFRDQRHELLLRDLVRKADDEGRQVQPFVRHWVQPADSGQASMGLARYRPNLRVIAK
ncbi:hypothetical protein GCM10027161_62480 [Microbispora hainanensis]